jgi:hypothetical protein
MQDIVWLKGGRTFEQCDLDRIADVSVEMRLTGKTEKKFVLSNGMEVILQDPNLDAVALGSITGVPYNIRVECFSPVQRLSYMVVERAFKRRYEAMREEFTS